MLHTCITAGKFLKAIFRIEMLFERLTLDGTRLKAPFCFCTTNLGLWISFGVVVEIEV